MKCLEHNYDYASINWFCAGSNPARGVSDIRDGGNLRKWFLLEMRLNGLSSVSYFTKQYSSSLGHIKKIIPASIYLFKVMIETLEKGVIIDKFVIALLVE